MVLADHHHKILALLSTEAGFATGDIAKNVYPKFGHNNRTHSAAVGRWLTELEDAGYVKKMDGEKPTCWVKVAKDQNAASVGINPNVVKESTPPELGHRHWVLLADIVQDLGRLHSDYVGTGNSYDLATLGRAIRVGHTNAAGSSTLSDAEAVITKHGFSLHSQSTVGQCIETADQLLRKVASDAESARNNNHAKALAKVEEAITAMQALPNHNVEFTFGIAMGLLDAYVSSEMITWEEYKDASARCTAIHDQQILVMRRSGNKNFILKGDK